MEISVYKHLFHDHRSSVVLIILCRLSLPHINFMISSSSQGNWFQNLACTQQCNVGHEFCTNAATQLMLTTPQRYKGSNMCMNQMALPRTVMLALKTCFRQTRPNKESVKNHWEWLFLQFCLDLFESWMRVYIYMIKWIFQASPWGWKLGHHRWVRPGSEVVWFHCPQSAPCCQLTRWWTQTSGFRFFWWF